MATPTWNQITAPNFSAGNDLIAQAMAQLTKATTGFKGIADEYKDTIQKRNLGLIQEYVNSAKTPEELQSEGFQAGLAKLTGGMAGEYDTLAKAQIVDKAADTLLSRKANQVSIDTNQFNLDTGRKNQLTKETTNKILAAPPEQRDALKQAAADLGAFDASVYQDYVQGEGAIRNQDNANKLFNATYNATVDNANLAPVVTRHGMRIADRNATTAEMNAQTNKLQAEAAAARAEEERKAKQNEKNPALLLLSGIDKIDKTYASEKLKPDSNPNAANTLTDWWNKQNSIFLSDTDLDNIKNTIETDPKLSKLSGKEKVFLAETSFQAIKSENTVGRNILPTDGNREQAAEVVKRVYSDISNRENDYLYSQKIPLYRDAVRQQMIQTGTRDPVQAARNVGMNEYEMYRTNIRTPLQSMAESLYDSSGSTLPKEQFVDKFIYRSVNKEPVDDLTKPKQEAANVPAQSSPTFLKVLGRGSNEDKVALISSELKKTRDPIQIAFLESELKKAEQSKPVVQASATATSPQSKTGNPLQQTALPPNVNKLISTPLDIVTNPSTIKTKPVADPLRQAALEQPPVPTNNTSQPRQLPPAEIAQKGRKEQPFTFTDTPLKVLTDAAKLKEATLPVVPAIAVKPEEVKSRELTPAEKQQEERMTQAAMVRLAGTKLKEKQAEVQKQFPDTPLKELAKAATPVPSPLIPVESQNAFRVKENNLALDFRTGKGTPTKDPVPMPKVAWKEPVQAVTINPIYAQLPQHKVVATFVPDGDTINATSDAYKTKGEKAKKAGGIICRIDSIETPETAKPQYGKKGQPYGAEAAKILQQMVLNKEISIRVTKPTDGESNYGRDVCQIEVAGKDVSVELLRAGAAWLYKEYNNYGQGGFDLESTARQSKLGLWGLPNPIYPPDFRHNGYQNP